MARKVERIADVRALTQSIYDALSKAYPDETPVLYEFAVHPKTHEVKVINGFSELPEGFFYEAATDAEWDTIWEIANSYFDVRR